MSNDKKPDHQVQLTDLAAANADDVKGGSSGSTLNTTQLPLSSTTAAALKARISPTVPITTQPCGTVMCPW